MKRLPLGSALLFGCVWLVLSVGALQAQEQAESAPIFSDDQLEQLVATKLRQETIRRTGDRFDRQTGWKPDAPKAALPRAWANCSIELK